MKHVILGAGPAGVIAAETIRKHRDSQFEGAQWASRSRPTRWWPKANPSW